jgi:hypothetical protein
MDDVVDHIIRGLHPLLLCHGVPFMSTYAVTVQTGMITAILAALDFILFLGSVSA